MGVKWEGREGAAGVWLYVADSRITGRVGESSSASPVSRVLRSLWKGSSSGLASVLKMFNIKVRFNMNSSLAFRTVTVGCAFAELSAIGRE